MNSTPAWPFETPAAGILAPGRRRPLRAVAWALLLSAGAFGCFLLAQYLSGWLRLPPRGPYYTVLGVPVLTFIVYAAIVRLAERRPPSEVLPHRGMMGELALGALLGAVMLAAGTALLWGLGLYQLQPGHWERVWDSFVFNSYLSGMLEELLFRAILLRILGLAFGRWWGLGLSAILFGAAHLSHGDVLAVVSITLNGGLVLGLAYMATGRLWLAVGLHTAWDFTEDSLLGINSRSGLLHFTPVAGKPELLTGGSYGPDSSVLFLVIGAVMVGLLLHLKQTGRLSRLGDMPRANP